MFNFTSFVRPKKSFLNLIHFADNILGTMERDAKYSIFFIERNLKLFILSSRDKSLMYYSFITLQIF